MVTEGCAGDDSINLVPRSCLLFILITFFFFIFRSYVCNEKVTFLYHDTASGNLRVNME